MAKDTRDSRDDDPPRDGAKERGLFEDVARAIGRTAGRTKDALARLGERGVTAVATKRLEHERSIRLEELGRLARKALASPEGCLRADDPRVVQLLAALERLDQKLARMRGGDKRGGDGAEAASED